MSKFFNKIRQAVKAAYARLLQISPERWLFFSLGEALTAFGALTLKITWAPVIAVAVGGIHAFVLHWNNKPLQWKNYAALALGALLIMAMPL